MCGGMSQSSHGTIGIIGCLSKWIIVRVRPEIYKCVDVDSFVICFIGEYVSHLLDLILYSVAMYT